MADPVGLASGVVALATFSVQASKSLYTTIESFKNHPKAVRELKNELQALNDVLQALGETITSSTGSEFALLELPLRRCGNVCKEFEAVVLKCTQNSKESRTSFRDWAKLRYMDGDINGFKDVLAGYKSTITIALGGANLRASAVSTNLLSEYSGMIRDTKTDLEARLCEINEKLEGVSICHVEHKEPVEQSRIQEERNSTIRCLEICAQVSTYIEQRQSVIIDDVHTLSDGSEAKRESGKVPSRQIVASTLRECKEMLKGTDVQLSARLQLLGDSLQTLSSGPLTMEGIGKMKEEMESTQQCLNICGQAAREAEKMRVNVAEDVSVAEDGQQILVSTIGDLISARRVTAGARSLQCFGQMSDESLQQISRGLHKVPTETPTGPSSHTAAGFEFQYGVGRDLKT